MLLDWNGILFFRGEKKHRNTYFENIISILPFRYMNTHIINFFFIKLLTINPLDSDTLHMFSLNKICIKKLFFWY